MIVFFFVKDVFNLIAIHLWIDGHDEDIQTSVFNDFKWSLGLGEDIFCGEITPKRFQNDNSFSIKNNLAL